MAGRVKRRLHRRPGSQVERALRALMPMPCDFAEHDDWLVTSWRNRPDDPDLEGSCSASPYRLASARYERDIPLRSTPRPTDGFSDDEIAKFN